MTNGPPLKFKRICADTGRELKTTYGYASATIEIASTEVICQSTGLHDSKGQEIYFGDCFYTDSGIYTVIYYEGMAVSLHIEDFDSLDKIYSFDFTELHKEHKYIKIIGNRYQSREQLEAKAKEIE